MLNLDKRSYGIYYYTSGFKVLHGRNRGRGRGRGGEQGNEKGLHK